MGIPGWQILLRQYPTQRYNLLTGGGLPRYRHQRPFFRLPQFPGAWARKLATADWGQLLSFARNWISDLAKFWYIVVFPGSALILFVLGWNLIGDAFRDALDPRSRNR